MYVETGSVKRVSLYGKSLYMRKKAHTYTENTNQFRTYPEHTCKQFPGVNLMLVQSFCVLTTKKNQTNSL